MGFEHRATFSSSLNEVQRAELIDQIARFPGWIVVEQSPDDLKLASSAHALRADWPEDVTIAVAENEAYAVFHMWGERNWEGLLRDIETAILSLGGGAAEFEAL